MRSIKFTLLVLIGFLTMAQAQFVEPVKWSFDTEDLGDGTYALLFKARIDDGWHLYSHYIEDGGPIPTSFYYDESESYALSGKLEERGDRVAAYDEIFKMDVAWFKKAATFRQKIRLTGGAGTAVVKGELEFMVCNDRECLPPEYVPFRLAVGAKSKSEAQVPPEKTTPEKPAVTPISPTPVEPGAIIPAVPGDASGEYEHNAGTDLTAPVGWSYRVLSQRPGEVTLQWKAELADGWHLYSSYISDEGPIPTSFFLEGNTNVTPVDTLLELGDRVTRFDDIFEMELSWFDTEVIFQQNFRWTDTSNRIFTGAVEFMVCDDEQCLPPEEVPFNIDLTSRDVWIAFGDDGTAVQPSVDCEGIPDIMCAGEFNQQMVADDCTGDPVTESSSNYWLIFLIGFGGGLIALLTPCVFPMIPLTVSFFTKGGEKANAKGVRNAFIYGLSIIVIYVSMGLFVTLTFGPEMLNWIATDPVFNIFFFLIFVFFAFSFFGYYELTLPANWTNKTDQIAAKGGLIGIFFMAFTLALVSFSCTGPIIGSLIVEAVRQGVMGPFFGMLGFAVALALPFTLFAVFPKWLNSLPQSGGWLNSVKVSLGFLELAFALKFFSTADLTRHWGLLKYELFIGIWVLIFLLMGLYLLGVYRFPHDSKGPSGWLKRGFGIGSLAFSVFLLVGMLQHKPLLGGIAPAPGYSYFNPSKCPDGVNICFHDYEEGMEYARANNQPVMLDFTGYGCVNCRLMENNVWSDDEVNKLLNEYVIISLYVDDRADLPVEKQYTSAATGKLKEIKKVGKYWHDFQFRHFGTLSQPYYVLLGPDKEILNKPIAFSGKEEYLEFLQCGLDNLSGVCPECAKAAIKP